MAAVNIRVKDEDKAKVEEILSQLGLNLSVATNAFYKQIIIHNGLPFELKTDPFHSEANKKRLEKSIAQMEKKGGTIHEVLDD